ncbi:tetratricopeptide repeat protein [Pedobacter alpinus]|uniref:Tetratricopeptide repeat protein n=2 Tax=Pedobacter alpinus TaxID=1590643 RepID=A0ABW5TNG8_9SPHI
MNVLKVFFTISLCFAFISSMAQSENDAELAKHFYTNGEYGKSLAIYQKLYNSLNGNDLYFSEYYTTLLKLKKYDEAEKIINKKIKNNFKYGVDLGQLYLEKGETDKANKTFENVISKTPAVEFTITDIANSFYGIANFEFAIKTFLNGRRLLKDDNAFTYELINLYRYKKLKEPLTYEVVNLVENEASFLANAKNTISRAYESTEDYETLKSILFKKIQKNPQNINFINLLAWVFLQQKQYDLALVQLIALDRRLNDTGGSVYNFATILVENKAFETAEKAFNYLLNKPKNSPYYIASRIGILKCKNIQIINTPLNNENIKSLGSDYEKLLDEYGKNNQTIFALRDLANLEAFYLDNEERAIELLELSLNLPNVKLSDLAEIKLDLAHIYTLNNQPWDAALLYGQVEKSFEGDVLGQEAKFKNAKLSFYNGDFNWAKAQLDVLKASTSQLIANDALDLSLLIQDNLNSDSSGQALKMYAKADLLLFKNQYDIALLTLDSIGKLYPQTDLADDILMLKAQTYNKQKQYELAKENFLNLIANYSYSIWADDALFNLAVLEEEFLNDSTNAKIHFEKLINDYPGSLYVIEARKRFRNLRGDVL